MEEEKKNHDAKMRKMEVEMEQVFEIKVKERTLRITDSEKDVSLLIPFIFYIQSTFSNKHEYACSWVDS